MTILQLTAEIHRIMGLAPVHTPSDLPVIGGPTSTDSVMIRMLGLPEVHHTSSWGTVRSRFSGVPWVACSSCYLTNTVALVGRALDGGASINAADDALHLSEARSLGLRGLAARLLLANEFNFHWEGV